MHWERREEVGYKLKSENGKVEKSLTEQKGLNKKAACGAPSAVTGTVAGCELKQIGGRD